MERLKPTSENCAVKIEFLEKRLAEKDIYITPEEFKTGSKKLKDYRWEQIVNIGLLYNMGSENTFAGIGKLYGLSRQATEQANKKFLLFAYTTSSKELRKAYPLSSIPFGKPASQAPKERALKINKEIDDLVWNKINDGITQINKIASELILPKDQISRSLKRLEASGAYARIKPVSYEELKAINEGQTSDLTGQKILNKLSSIFIISLIRRSVKDKYDLFGFVGKTLRELGYKSTCAKEVSRYLRDNRIPVRVASVDTSQGKHTYHLYFSKDRERVNQAIADLGNSDNIRKEILKTTDIALFSGELEEGQLIPNTSQMQNRTLTSPIQTIILDQLNFRIGERGGLTAQDFLQGCPVPVFKYFNTYTIYNTSIPGFQKFIRRRYAEIKIN